MCGSRDPSSVLSMLSGRYFKLNNLAGEHGEILKTLIVSSRSWFRGGEPPGSRECDGLQDDAQHGQRDQTKVSGRTLPRSGSRQHIL